MVKQHQNVRGEAVRQPPSKWKRKVLGHIGKAVLPVLMVFSANRAAGDFQPWGWVYKSCHGSFADVVASSFGIMVGLPVAGVCGLVLFPADVAHEIRTPQDKFFHHSRSACVVPFAAVGGAGYLLGGAPFYAVQWLVWDLPHGACPPGPPPVPTRPEKQPARSD